MDAPEIQAFPAHVATAENVSAFTQNQALRGKAPLTRAGWRPNWMAQLLYGFGLRLMECVRPRVGDGSVECRTITVQGGRGEKGRVLPLP